MEKPPVLSRRALDSWTEEYEMAKYHIMDDPFWMPFVLINREILREMLDANVRLYAVVHYAAREAVIGVVLANGDRASMRADITAHPLFPPEMKLSLLRSLYPEVRSAKALQGGLPTLGKRR